MKTFSQYLLEVEMSGDVSFRKQAEEEAREKGLALLGNNEDVFLSISDYADLINAYNKKLKKYQQASPRTAGVYFVPPDSINQKDGWRVERISSFKDTKIHLTRIPADKSDFRYKHLRPSGKINSRKHTFH